MLYISLKEDGTSTGPHGNSLVWDFPVGKIPGRWITIGNKSDCPRDGYSRCLKHVEGYSASDMVLRELGPRIFLVELGHDRARLTRELKWDIGIAGKFAQRCLDHANVSRIWAEEKLAAMKNTPAVAFLLPTWCAAKMAKPDPEEISWEAHHQKVFDLEHYWQTDEFLNLTQ